MKRKITKTLLAWKLQTDNRMPLILYGARQVGKTHILQEFGRENYEDVIYINFETTPRLAAEFDADIDPGRILNSLELYFGRRIQPQTTLVIFDEVQVCERALTSLKYFCELAPEYHIAAAGSLLGVAVNREKYSFPVGKVTVHTLYPLDFEEFLWACGKEDLATEITGRYSSNTAMSTALHELALELYRTYLVVGGMPAAIREYLRDRRMIDAVAAQAAILNNYVADMAKYITPQETARTIACFDSLPNQLAKENRKFQYKVVKRGGSAALFGAAIDWLVAAGLAQKCDKIEHGYMPPAVYRDLSSFKLYFSDTGLLTLKSGVVPHDIIGTSVSGFIGALTENYVANMLTASGFQLYYWESNSQAEVDFVIQDYDKVIPVEVKADIHTRSRSLSVYISKYQPEYSIRISARNFGFENNIKSVPLYAVHCIAPRRVEI